MRELAALRPTLHQVLGTSHPRTLRARQQYAELLHRGGDTAAALGELGTTLVAMRAVHGDGHARVREVADLLTAWSAPGPSLAGG